MTSLKHSLHRLAGALLISLALTSGCSSAREVDVNGFLRRNASLNPPPAMVYIVEPVEGSAEGTMLAAVDLGASFEFQTTVAVNRERIEIYGVLDLDKSGSCDDGDIVDARSIVLQEEQERVDVELTPGPSAAGACP